MYNEETWRAVVMQLNTFCPLLMLIMMDKKLVTKRQAMGRPGGEIGLSYSFTYCVRKNFFVSLRTRYF
jgi:hypothetical protein